MNKQEVAVRDCFLERCRAAGLKATPQRLSIYAELAGTREHPDAETVYSRVRSDIPSISFDTVYRTLRVFTEHGMITRMSTATDRARFDAVMSPHHHFVCERCGGITDLAAEGSGLDRLPEGVSEIGKPKSVHIEIRGICRSCAKSKKQK
ncbi:MAG: Fur family transcriptional regulator [Kiritimatiellae bacterium]|nr:Fur family transcriptional regulator [Kiritimatiellia bacterium]